jgi:DNA-binding transcriptional MerR regulator
MRYTTVIDISEFPRVYKNPNARLIYLHMALKSGYHAEDKDKIKTSIRRIALAVGLTVSATRHALAQLERDQLITKIDGGWMVKKWVVESFPEKNQVKQKTAAQEEKERQQEKERQEWLEGLKSAVTNSTREELQGWLEALINAPEGKRVYHKGARLWHCVEHIEWLTKIIRDK